MKPICPDCNGSLNIHSDVDGEKPPPVGASRELSLAATKTEEAVMWAVKHITG